MKFMMHHEPLPVSNMAFERKRIARDRAARKLLSDRLIPGLPVDADALETRVKTPRVGIFFDEIYTALTDVHEPFFDTVCDNWSRLCADFPANPGRYRDGHLFLYVGTSGLVFSLRSKLPKIKKLLMALPGAPKRLTMHLEVHSANEKTCMKAPGTDIVESAKKGVIT